MTERPAPRLAPIFAPASALALALAATWPLGCSGPSAPKSEIVEENLALYDVGELIALHEREHGRPPARLADLDPYEPGFPGGFLGLLQGDLIVFWGAGIAQGPEAASTVLAYEASVPDSGGYVLTRDNAVRRMTAEQFAAAPKAGPMPPNG